MKLYTHPRTRSVPVPEDFWKNGRFDARCSRECVCACAFVFGGSAGRRSRAASRRVTMKSSGRFGFAAADDVDGERGRSEPGARTRAGARRLLYALYSAPRPCSVRAFRVCVRAHLCVCARSRVRPSEHNRVRVCMVMLATAAAVPVGDRRAHAERTCSPAAGSKTTPPATTATAVVQK